MADVGLRDLGSFVPGRRVREAGREPSAPQETTPRIEPRVAEPKVMEPKVIEPKVMEPKVAAPAVIVTPPPSRKAQQPVFAGDHPEGPDVLGVDPTLAQLAELTLHKGTKHPLAIGLIGGAGSGKSFALRRLSNQIRDLAAAAAKVAATTTGPFLSRVHIETIDAASLTGAPDLALAARLHAGLAKSYPDLAEEIGAAARDPHATLRAAEEKLDDARRRLDVERRALDEAGSRRARLTETVLYEASGSHIDVYARANRASIESRLHSFGVFGDPIRNYKDLVQLAAGAGSKTGLVLRALYAYKGQLKLLVAAVVLMAVGIGLGMAIDSQSVWLDSMRGGPKAGVSAADWMQSHIGLLATAKAGAYLLALLAVGWNVLRAVSFLRPVFKGARLLDGDLDGRRRDLDGLCAHQTKRVDVLETTVDRLTRDVAEAERRTGGGQGARREPSPFEPAGAPVRAPDAFAALSAAMTGNSQTVPQRIVVALDNLDATSSDRARAILDALHRASVSGLVTIVAADVARLDPEGTRRNDIERWIQVPFRLDAPASVETQLALLNDALGRGGSVAAKAEPDATRSDLDSPITDEEVSLLAALSELAGHTPRALKRFANLYRLARLGDERPLGPLAFMLAVMLGGDKTERQAVIEAVNGEPAARFDFTAGSPRLQAALNAAVAIGGRFTKSEAGEAARRATAFAL